MLNKRKSYINETQKRLKEELEKESNKLRDLVIASMPSIVMSNDLNLLELCSKNWNLERCIKVNESLKSHPNDFRRIKNSIEVLIYIFTKLDENELYHLTDKSEEQKQSTVTEQGFFSSSQPNPDTIAYIKKLEAENKQLREELDRLRLQSGEEPNAPMMPGYMG